MRSRPMAQSLPPVPKDKACTQIYGGPETASITGTWRGQPVMSRFARNDGCQIRSLEADGRTAASGRHLVLADDDLDPLELLDLGVSGGRHCLAQGADEVHGAVGDRGRAEQDVLEAADRRELGALTARQRVMPGLRSPGSAGRLLGLASGEPTMTASAPQAIALAISPELTTEPSAITCT